MKVLLVRPASIARAASAALIIVFIAGCGRSPIPVNADEVGTEPGSSPSGELRPGPIEPDRPNGQEPGAATPGEPGPGDPSNPPDDPSNPSTPDNTPDPTKPAPGEPTDPGPPPPPPPPPEQPDLWIEAFEAKLNKAGAIDYRVNVCNGGKQSAIFFRVDLFYNNPTAPLPLIAGDWSKFVAVLKGGDCTEIKHTYADVPVGVYSTRAAVDTLKTVAEANEDNNSAGPKMVWVSAESGCMSFCGFASTCGAVGWTDYTRCLDWCGGMEQPSQDCAFAAAKKLSCSELEQCSLPELPPKQAGMLSCYSTCNYLINDCKLLPADQLLTCIAGCAGLAASKRQCAQNAMQKKQCSALMLCLI